MGPGNEGETIREDESNISLMMVDILIPNSTPNPPGSSFLSNSRSSLFLGTNSHFSVDFPSVSRRSPALYRIDSSPFPVPSSFLLHTLTTFPFRQKQTIIMRQEPQEATDLPLIFKADIPRFENFQVLSLPN